jgi:hypothetical protein
MDVTQGVGQCASSQVGQIVQFGQRFADIFFELNRVCRELFEWITKTVFKNEQEVQSALSKFKNSVLESAGDAGCSRNEAKEVYQQVENFLLNPTNQNVAIKSTKKRRTDVADSLMHFLTTTDVSTSSSAQCVVCNSRGGIIVSCSGNKCKRTLHTFCAAAVTQCKNPPSRYYRCPKCPISKAGAAAVEVAATKKKGSKIGSVKPKVLKNGKVSTAKTQPPIKSQKKKKVEDEDSPIKSQKKRNGDEEEEEEEGEEVAAVAEWP